MRMTSKFMVGALLASGVASSVQAQTLFVSGFTRGCFGVGCIPALAAVLATPGLSSITFASSNFNGTTTAVTQALSVSNLGTFTVSNPTAGGGDQPFTSPFTLELVFTTPVTGGNPMSTFTVSGVIGDDIGSRDVQYGGSASNTVSFTGGIADVPPPLPPGLLTGNLRYTTADGNIGNVPATITGRIIQVSAVPEPASVALLGTGVVGLMAIAARRRRAV